MSDTKCDLDPNEKFHMSTLEPIILLTIQSIPHIT